MKKKPEPVNVFELCPRQLVGWEPGENNLVVVLVPKFRNRFAAKWIMPRLSKPYVRVKLDTLGSFAWKQCDGKTTVAEIADRMKKEFGESAEPVDERVPAFVLKLTKTDLLAIHNTESAFKTND
jgi:hypothetical protein